MEVNKISRLKLCGCYQSSVFRCGVFIPGRKYAPPEAKFFVFQNIGSATCPAKFKGIKKFKKSCVDLVYFCSGGNNPPILHYISQGSVWESKYLNFDKYWSPDSLNSVTTALVHSVLSSMCRCPPASAPPTPAPSSSGSWGWTPCPASRPPSSPPGSRSAPLSAFLSDTETCTFSLDAVGVLLQLLRKQQVEGHRL